MNLRIGTRAGNRNIILLSILGLVATVLIICSGVYTVNDITGSNHKAVNKISQKLRLGDAPQQAPAITAKSNVLNAESEEQQVCEHLDYYNPDTDMCITSTAQIGANPYWKADVSSPEAFYNATNGKGFDEGYGKQCVAGFKEFLYSISGRIVATTTGGASGYAYQQGQLASLGGEWHAGTAGVQNGDWVITTNGLYGHVGMFYNGYLYGQNQAGGDIYAGSPFAKVNLESLRGYTAGYYRWSNFHTYTPPAPTPQPTPQPEPTPLPTHDGRYFRWDEMYAYNGQRGYLWCYEYDNGGCWAR